MILSGWKDVRHFVLTNPTGSSTIATDDLDYRTSSFVDGFFGGQARCLECRLRDARQAEFTIQADRRAAEVASARAAGALVTEADPLRIAQLIAETKSDEAVMAAWPKLAASGAAVRDAELVEMGYSRGLTGPAQVSELSRTDCWIDEVSILDARGVCYRLLGGYTGSWSGRRGTTGLVVVEAGRQLDLRAKLEKVRLPHDPLGKRVRTSGLACVWRTSGPQVPAAARLDDADAPLYAAHVARRIALRVPAA